MQPYFFPYIGYYQLINIVEKFVVYDDVNFINRGWINRNNVLVNNKAYLFSIPLRESSQNKEIRDIGLIDIENWRLKFLKTIELSYKKAKYFNIGFEILRGTLNKQAENISQLAFHSLRAVIDYLDLNTEMVETSSVYGNTKLKAQERILDICKREKSEHYINPIGGIEIYSKELFERSSVKLSFLKTKPLHYRQFSDQFVPNLSMIDVMMFNSKEQIIDMLNLCELV
jgi:hypothetical protein